MKRYSIYVIEETEGSKMGRQIAADWSAWSWVGIPEQNLVRVFNVMRCFGKEIKAAVAAGRAYGAVQSAIDAGVAFLDTLDGKDPRSANYRGRR